MILLLLVYQLTQFGANAIPVPSIDEKTSSCLDIRSCRQLSDIIFSCLATLFTCNWVVLHPDVPKEGWDTSDIIRRRLWHAIVALVLPEVTLYNAIQEYFKAAVMTKELEKLAIATEQLEMTKENVGSSKSVEKEKAKAGDVEKKRIRERSDLDDLRGFSLTHRHQNGHVPMLSSSLWVVSMPMTARNHLDAFGTMTFVP